MHFTSPSLSLSFQNQYDQSQAKHLTVPSAGSSPGTEAQTAAPKALPLVAMPIYAASFSLLQRKQ